MNFELQPHLENDQVVLVPLKEDDFDALFQVASDPKVWEQHPNKYRWQKEEFQKFFEGAIKSRAAYKVVIKSTGEVAGSTRIYDYNEADQSILIGYTFYGTKFWGTGINHAVKRMMMDYLFQFVDKIYYHIGACNLRSQISISRLGATKVGEIELSYYGEPPTPNFVYLISKEDYTATKSPSL